MNSRWEFKSLLVAISLCGLLNVAAAQRSETTSQPLASSSCRSANAVGAVTVHALSSGAPALSLCDGHTLSGGLAQVGSGQPLALASADFDEDGMPDLVSGFGDGKSGRITVHRGNVAALWPYGAALRNGPPAAFLPNPRTVSLPEAPDFLVTGDFDADGHWDIVAARRGSDALYWVRGDGHGRFYAPQRVALGGAVTALIAGEINRADGLADLIVAINGANGTNGAGGPRALVFESPTGALKGQPEIFKLAHPATALALSRFDGGSMRDLAVAAGNQIVLIHARDRKLAQGEEQRASVARAMVTVQEFPFAIRTLTAGDFTGTGPGIAALDEDGNVHLLVHGISATSESSLTMGDPNFHPTMQVSKGGKGGKSVVSAGRMTPGLSAKLSAMRASVRASGDGSEWTEHSVLALPGGYSQATPQLVMGRVTGSLQDDLLVPDAGNRQIHVLSSASNHPRARSSVKGQRLNAAAPVAMKLMASLEAADAPVAVLPMRLNQHGLNGMVALHAGQGEPTVMPQDAPPANIFTVTNTSDAIIRVETQYTGPAGSLRKAIYDANNATGTASIVFNIPTSDPGYNAQTGTFLIQPLSESVPGAFNNFALPPIDNTMTIDGYTQPGASPNTLANGDNAKILIRIDGGKATTPGGAGLVPFDDVGSVFRGLDFTGWTLGAINNNTESGAEGIEANGVADFIEGNFFGTDTTGKAAAPNRIGIFADNGPGFGSTVSGNTIGGTTPQARNILSGNTLAGILFLSTAIEGQLKGNFIGLDTTGATILPNGSDGAGLNGPTVTIGGTLAGAGNVISGNPTNVDINDITEGNAAKNSQVQGNLIGTDATGTKSPSGGKDVGVSIIAGPSNMLIGGTTPAARNIISGNNYGVYIYDGSFNNIVQGNYIGTDVTGSKAVGNTVAGFATGVDTDPLVQLGLQISAADTTLGGSVAGAGNVISGNGGSGVSVEGSSNGQFGQNPLQGNTIQGNFIGTDPTGKTAVPNKAHGISLTSGANTSGATNNVIGGSNPGSGNLVANNLGDGIHIDPGVSDGSAGYGNNSVGNIILANKGAGIRMASGTSNRISRNSISSNGGLGIDLATTGPNAISHCNTDNTGANGLQNSPTLTTGSGSGFITATATDPSGNTSEFSNAVQAPTSGSVISLLGNFDSKASTAYTIEFFSNTAADPSGFGEGQTYIGSTSVTTGSDCTIAINDPVNTAQADVSVALTSNVSQLLVGPDYGANVYSYSVANNGVATAHDVVFTDTLPAGLLVSSLYCNVGPCQTPVVTSLGTCTVSGQTITCNLGTMAAGASAAISIPVEATTAGSLVTNAKVSATEADPNLANNTATSTAGVIYPLPFTDAVSPTSVLVNSASFPLIVYGENFLHETAISFNGTALPTTAVYDNQPCTDSGQAVLCTGIQVEVPASLVKTAGTVVVEATNPSPTYGGQTNFPTDFNFVIAPSCVYSIDGNTGPSVVPFFSPEGNDGTTLIPEFVDVGVNVQSCSWTAKSTVPWATVLKSYNNGSGGAELNAVGAGGTVTGSGEISIAIAPNTGSASRSGSITVGPLTVNFTQDGGATCDFPLTPSTATATAAGGSGSFNVTTGSSCTYFVESEADWITIPKASGLLTGTATPNYSVAANTGPPRTGAVLVGGEGFTVNQAGPSCYYTLSDNAESLPVSGGTGSIGVTASSPGCKWTAKSSDSSHLAVTSGASGTGNGTVNYSVPANTDGPQMPSLTIGDATGFATFTVTQASAYTCTFTLSPTSVEVSSNGASNFILVKASFYFCKWTANSSDPTALAINGANSGTGTKAIYYSVAQNTTGKPRVLTLVAGCETFTINQDAAAAGNPVPAITTLQPASAATGSGAFTLTVNGSGFINGSVVNFNGIARVTTFVSATKLTAAILASDVATAGAVPVTVTNPSPGGGTSNAATFTITTATNPVPAITTLLPATVKAGSGAFTLTVNGTGFVNGSVVNFKGAARATTFVSATKLTAAILAADVASVGTPSVTVTNPAPGGGISNSVTLTISVADNPAPTITALQPASATAGSGALTLTVNGTGFVSASVVNFSGSARATTFVSATQLTAAILATDVASVGTPKVTVTSPIPGGGTSNAVTFTVTAANNPTPVISTLLPATVKAGSGAFMLTLNGTGFVTSSVVKFNGGARTTTFISATQLTAAILANDVANVGTPPVTVTNPVPGGGVSNSVTFTITAANNPAPTVTTLLPATVKAGSGAFTLTVNGTGFVGSSVVKFNGATRTTTFVSATQVKASILAGDIASTGTPSIAVANPTPGGGTSNSVTFTITQANNPAPTITTLQPSSATAGSAGFTLTVNGTGFVSTSVVNFGGGAHATTFVSDTQLTASILASDIATTGAPAVTVTSPAPGGGTSNAVTFTVNPANNPVPAITVLQPASVSAGSAAFALTVQGTGFVSGSVVKLNGTARATTFVSATQLSAAITAADVATAGSASITVTSPAPGGGTSNALTLAITTVVTPLASLNPTALTFPSTDVGASAAAQTIVLSNSGTGPLAISNIAIVGANPSAFSQTNNCGSSLAVAATCSIAVTFKPNAAASLSATLTVADNAAGSPQTATLSGVGVAVPAPVASLTPASLTFSAVAGTTSAAQTATLKNTGDAPLTISGSTITGTNASAFALTLSCSSSLAGNESCTFSIKFTPPTTGSFTATLSVADNAAGSPHTVSLTGTGTPPPSFTITSSTTAQTIAAGGSAQYSVSVNAKNGAFGSPVTLAASGLPTGATATFAPPSVTPGNASATSVLTIQTAAATPAVAGFGRSIVPVAFAGLPLLGLFLVARRFRKRWLSFAVLLLASLGAIGTLSGCGGGFSLPGSGAKNYTITITGTSGAEQQTTTVQLTVQ